jgi:hypothetical protein
MGLFGGLNVVGELGGLFFLPTAAAASPFGKVAIGHRL